jgi:hypothetical protein
MGRAVRFADQVRALWKPFLSLRKRDWELTDYPVVFRIHEPDPSSPYQPPRFKLHRCVASIVNWHLTGSGDSREEALQSLRGTFASVKLEKQESCKPLPRPGKTVPIEFASQERVKAHPELAEDFIHRVLGLEWAWISDGSSLWDFHTGENNDALYAKIKEVYGVDVSDIHSAKLQEILERISVTQKLNPT